MTFLYPIFLLFILPLGLMLWKSPKIFVPRVHTIILILLFIALARPVQEQSLEEMPIEAKEIIIALDVSYSMNAKDLLPSRYGFAKATINALLKANPSDNIMLLAFTSNPLLLSPPTTDHALITIALDSLNPKFILTKGTSLQRLFTKLGQMNTKDKNIILMTDGGEKEDVQALASLIISSQMHLHILGLGSISGTTISQEDGSILKDKEGNLLISRLNPMLKSLASAVQGSYSTASLSPSLTASALDSLLQSQSDQSLAILKKQRHYKERYGFPLALALILFFMLHTRFVKYLLLLALVFGFSAQASMWDSYHLFSAYKAYENKHYSQSIVHLKKIQNASLESQMALASSYYQENRYQKALDMYLSIRSSSASIKQKLFYNIANSYALQGKYSKAKSYYIKALNLGKDPQSQSNLERIVFLIDKQKASLGIAHPKSQDSASSKSQNQEKDSPSPKEDEPSSGSGSGGEQQKTKQKQKQKLQEAPNPSPHPLSSKVYELINKGYIYEKEPW